MNITPILEALKAAGATADMLIAAVQAYEIEVNKKIEGRRAKDAERQRRHRLSRDVTVTNVTPPSSFLPPCPPLSPHPNPPLNPPNLSPTPAARLKIQLDELSVDHIAAWLAKKRTEGKYREHDEHFVLDYFKNYCRSKGKKYDDYAAAYRNSFEWEPCQPKANKLGWRTKQLAAIHAARPPYGNGESSAGGEISAGQQTNPGNAESGRKPSAYAVITGSPG